MTAVAVAQTVEKPGFVMKRDSSARFAHPVIRIMLIDNGRLSVCGGAG
jgi:hypothetical protein